MIAAAENNRPELKGPLIASNDKTIYVCMKLMIPANHTCPLIALTIVLAQTSDISPCLVINGSDCYSMGKLV